MAVIVLSYEFKSQKNQLHIGGFFNTINHFTVILHEFLKAARSTKDWNLYKQAISLCIME